MPGRNHQPRPPRGGPNPSTPSHTSRPTRPRPGYSPVPPYASITPGTSVSLVLKMDQPTGRQVCGIVAELLTRGDHPRGVKVRLRDGRVGRVQKLVSEEEGLRGEGEVGGAEAGLGRDGESGRSGGSGRRGGRGGGREGYRFEKDIREDDEYFYDESRVSGRDTGLFAQLEEADRRHEESRGTVGAKAAEIVVCPVCGLFEGDERAVAFHVEGHFAEG